MKKPKYKLTKKRIFKLSQGAISILLCILVTPFLTIAGALIELSRYQSAVETMQEVVDSSLLSTLASYDEFLEDRFGLFAVSQEEDMANNFNKYITANSAILGGAITLENPSAVGKYTLANEKIMKTQLLDFSESTVMTETILENFKIQDILDQFENLDEIKDLSNMASNLADATKSLKTTVETAMALKDSIESVANAANNVKQEVTNLFNEIVAIYNDLNTQVTEFELIEKDDGTFDFKITIEKDGDTKTYDNIKSYLFDLYEKDKTHFTKIQSAINNISANINTIKNGINAIPTQFNKLKTDLADTKSKFESLVNTSNSKKSGSAEDQAIATSTEAATDALTAIVDELEDAVSEAGDSLKQETVNAIKTTYDEALEKIKNSFTISSSPLLDGTLSGSASENISQLIIKFIKYEKDHGGFNKNEFLNDFINFVLPGGLSTFTSEILNFKNILTEVISEAENNLEKKIGDSLINLLKKLVAAIRGLFDLDLFFNKDLTATLSDEIAKDFTSDSTNNPYQTFLNGLSKMFNAITDFADSIKGLKLLKFIKAFADLCDSIATVFSSGIQLAISLVNKVKDFANMFVSDEASLLDFMLLAGYMVHDLPNRTTDFKNDSALTGYSYDGFGTNKNRSGIPSVSGIEGLAKFMKDAHNGGSDTTFDGAELEYIVAGTQSEVMNQVVAFMQVYFLRLILDIKAVFTDPAVIAMAATATIASWAVYVLVLFGEPLCDTVILVNESTNSGDGCYLLKSRCYLSPSGVANLIDKIANIAVSNSNVKDAIVNDLKDGISAKDPWSSDIGAIPPSVTFDYEDHLFLCIAFLVTETDLISRFTDLVQVEAKDHYTNTGFNINKTYACITCKAKVTFNPFISVFEATDSSPFVIEYEQDRSY